MTNEGDKRKRFKKIFLIVCSILIILPVLVILFISPITKCLIEKYSVKYTGRQINLSRAYVNPFTGYVHLSNVKIYEAQSDSVFFSAKGISANFALRKLFSKTYEISSLEVDKPNGLVILNKRSHFNFDDLIRRFTPVKSDTITPPLHFNILQLKIHDGVFCFRSVLSKINYFIKDVDIECSGKRWSEDTTEGKFSFSSGTGSGDMKGTFFINFSSLDYRYTVVATKYSLDIIQQYLKDIVNYGTFSANLDADLQSTGNFKDEDNLDAKGRFAINDFHFGKNPQVDYLSFDKFVMAINEVNPEKHLYNLDSVVLTHPYFKYEKYDHLDNLETMFGEMGSNVVAVDNNKEKFNLIIELAHYLIDISKNFFESEYKVNKVALSRGDFQFNDYSVSEQFSIGLNPVYLNADSINRDKGKVNVSLKTGIKPYGSAFVYATINPRDSETFDVAFHFEQIPITIFNPYLISYTSFPFDRGTIEFTGNWQVRDGKIQSQNHLIVMDPHIAKRQKNRANSWAPMRLAMYLARGSDNVIDYQIPVTGNLKKPKLHLRNVILNALRNIVVKPIVTPYRIIENREESIINQSLNLRWDMRQSILLRKQEKFLKKMMDYLVENPTAIITITPENYDVKEKEYILFFEAKKKYYLSLNTAKSGRLNEEDSEYVDRMSVKDSLFVNYLNKHLNHSLIFTIQGKCSCLIDPAIVNTKFNQLNKERTANFLSLLKGKGIDSRIIFNLPQNKIPYNGFSFYKIAYKGDLPNYLTRAYNEMAELNGTAPRKKYEKEREAME